MLLIPEVICGWLYDYTLMMVGGQCYALLFYAGPPSGDLPASDAHPWMGPQGFSVPAQEKVKSSAFCIALNATP